MRYTDKLIGDCEVMLENIRLSMQTYTHDMSKLNEAHDRLGLLIEEMYECGIDNEFMSILEGVEQVIVEVLNEWNK